MIGMRLGPRNTRGGLANAVYSERLHRSKHNELMNFWVRPRDATSDFPSGGPQKKSRLVQRGALTIHGANGVAPLIQRIPRPTARPDHELT